MDMQFNHQDHKIHAALSGSFTFEDNRSFREILQTVEKGSIRQVTLDVSALDYVDSAALGMLMMLHNLAEEHSVSVTLKGPRGAVKRTFELSRFTDLFYIAA